MGMYKIMIVEDDAVIASAMAKHIAGWGYEVRSAEDFQNVMGLFSEFSPTLVLLDISLPFYNGYHWCTEIRKVSQVPVDLHFICVGQSEYYHGYEHGRRRFYRQAL